MTEPDQPAPDLDTARLTLDTAVQQLTQPSSEVIRRDTADHPDVAATEVEHQRRSAELRGQHAAATRRGDGAAMRRVLARLIRHEQEARARRSGRGHTPSLLDQLRDEIGASSNTGAGGSAGPYRSIIAIPAAELHAHSHRTVGAPRGAEQLHDHVRRWATDPHDVVRAATEATSWVEQIRTMLNPAKRWHHPGACPGCGASIAHVRDTSGEIVRKPAIEFDRERGRARCLRCPAKWETEAQLHNLARVLNDQHAIRIS